MTDDDYPEDLPPRMRAIVAKDRERRERSLSRQSVEDDWSGWHRGKSLPTALVHATDDAAFTISPELGGAGMLFAVLRYGNKELGRFFGPSAAAKALTDGEFDSLIGTSAKAFRVPRNPIDWKRWRA